MESIQIPINDHPLTPAQVSEHKKLVEDSKKLRNQIVESARLIAYQTTADPLFFKWKAGEATEQEWLDARAAVVASNPYPNDV